MRVINAVDYSEGSMTSGVDGSSEGGRVNTNRMSYVLVLGGIPLMQRLRRQGYKGRLDPVPWLEDGVWALKLIYDGEKPKDVPRVWHGHRVVLEQAEKSGGA